MKSTHAIIVLGILFLNQGFSQENSEQEQAAVQTFKIAPSYFIPNTAHNKTGKKLVDDDEVIAFIQTQKGRVMFTPSGAFIGMIVPAGEHLDPHTMEQANKAGLPHEDFDYEPMVKTRTVVLKTGFAASTAKKRGIVPRLEEATSGTVNFMVGPKENWRTKVPTYRKLIYDKVWDGITLEYLGFMDHLEFRLLLDPGSDPHQIAIETGGEELQIQEDGRLLVSLAGAELVLSQPLAFQEIGGKTIKIPVQYQILSGKKLGFKLGAYSPDVALIIDPTLIWSTYLGGPGGDGTETGRAIAVDSTGNAYITGYTPAADYPVTTGAYDETWNGGNCDVFVSKLNIAGTALLYSTFLGGTGYDRGYGIAVDSTGQAYVTGFTYSSVFPTSSGAFDEVFNGDNDVFVSKLSADGGALTYSTFLGGSFSDYGYGIVVDSAGQAYVTGSTFSSNYPTTSGAYDESKGGSNDVFVSKLSANGRALMYSTFLGGSRFDKGSGITVDDIGQAYITGVTDSNGYPTTTGVFDETHNDYYDVFVSKLSSDGCVLVYSTFLGGSSHDEGHSIAVDSVGQAYVTGFTLSNEYPSTIGAYDETHNSAFDVFVSKLSADGDTLIYSSFLGGAGQDYGYGVAVDSSGNAYVTGYTSSSSYPTASGSFDETHNGGYYDVFVSKLSTDGSALIYSTFLGGTGSDYGYGIAVDSSGNTYVTGHTGSSGYPTISGSFDEAYNGGYYDVFVSKLRTDGSALIYSSFLGGTSYDEGYGIAVDSSGNAYVTGRTDSSGYPTSSGSYDETYNGSDDVFVSKLSSDGSGLSYSTFLGGTGHDYGNGIAVDSTGNAYVTGYTGSSGYPTISGSFDETYNGGNYDVFVSKLSTDGSALIYSTFLGGTNSDYGICIAVDSTGNTYVTGNTYSSGYPTTSGSYDETHGGSDDVFVSKLSSDGSALSYSTFLGGTSHDYGAGIVVDSANNAYVTGQTESSGYPTTSGSFDETHNGSYDVFVSKLSSDGSGLSYSTFLGGTNSDGGNDIAVDSSGNAYVTGYTYSSSYPTTSGSYDEVHCGNSDVFVSKLSSDGSFLSYSTFLGGMSADYSKGIALDCISNAYVTGYTGSSGFPMTSGSYDETHNGGNDVFVSKLSSDGSVLSYSTFLGGTSYDEGYGIAVDSIGNAYVTGYTYSSGFPTTSGSYDETQNGYGDAFVSKINCSVCSAPDQPGSITGETTVCANDIGKVYSISAVSGGTGYTWAVPSGAGITAGQGTTSITVSFGTASGNISVTADNQCGSSVVQSLAITVSSIPEQPGNISGDADVCENDTGKTYSIASVTGATGYTWSVPSDTIIISGQDTTSITVSFGVTSGNISVTADGDCGSSPPQNLVLTVGSTPEQPGPITGDTSVCENDQGKTYSISPVPGATDYTWTAPPDAEIVSGQGSTSVSVDFGGGSGEMSVSANHNCGSSTPQVLAITINSEPSQPGLINGETQVCSNDSNKIYFISSIPGSTGYTWTVPSDAVITSGQGSSSITVSFGTISGNISVTADNQCGSSDVQSSTVTVNSIPEQPGNISGDADVCANDTGKIYSIASVTGATGYTWSVPSDAIIISGQGTTSITVGFDVASGNITATADSACGSSPSQSLVLTVGSIPDQPGSISGDIDVCHSDAGVIYSIQTVPGATSYTWAVPTDAIITSGQGSHTVTVAFGSSSGDVTVTAENRCGSSSPQILAIQNYEPVVIQSTLEDLEACPGEQLYAAVVVTGGEPLSYLWLKDDLALTDGGSVSGSQTTSLIIDPLVLSDEGSYLCEISNPCSTESSTPFYLSVGGEFDVAINPPSAAQGLNPLIFTVTSDCEIGQLTYEWTDLMSGDQFQGNPLVLPVVDQSTEVQLIASDQSRAVVTKTLYVLCHSSELLDLDSDNCNLLADMFMLLDQWKTTYLNDPNDDGFIDVRDFMYINTDSSPSCATQIHFPDPVFKNYLINGTWLSDSQYIPFDVDGDGEISYQEAEQVTGELNCVNLGITNLTGVEYFTNLTILNCTNNVLTSLPDLSAMTQLAHLHVGNNQLSFLPDLSPFPLLESLSFENNQIQDFPDLSENPLMQILMGSGNTFGLDDCPNIQQAEAMGMIILNYNPQSDGGTLVCP